MKGIGALFRLGASNVKTSEVIDLNISYINYSFKSVDGDPTLTHMSATVSTKTHKTAKMYYDFIIESVRNRLESADCAYTLEGTSEIYEETSMRISSGLKFSVMPPARHDGKPVYCKYIQVSSDLNKKELTESTISMYTDASYDIMSLLLQIIRQEYVGVNSIVKPELDRLYALIDVVKAGDHNNGL